MTRAPPPSAPTGHAVTDAWRRGDLKAQLGGQTGTPRQGGTLRVQVYSRIPSLNPVTTSDWWVGRTVQAHVYESLVGLDAADHPRYRRTSRLAESWEIDDGGRTYTFRLRRGVRWHDGKDFTARDVVATFDKIMDPAVHAAHMRSYLEGLRDYVALDAHTVRFRFEDVRFDRMDNMFAEFPIQPAHVIEGLSAEAYDDPARNPLDVEPVGTGPFIVTAWTDDRMVWARNEGYWGRPAYLDRIDFIYVAEPEDALEMARRGDLDIVTRVRSRDWNEMDEGRFREGFFRSLFYDVNYAWIGWNQARPMFADRRVRRALTMLTDRERIIGEVLEGLGIPTNCHFYHLHPECEGLPSPLPFDPADAQALLDEAGWRDSDGDGVRDRDGAPFAFEFMVPASSEQALALARLLQGQLFEAGIRMDVSRVEWPQFTARLRDRNFDAATLLWGASGPRTEPSQIWHSRSIEGGSNYVGFSNEEADELMDRARSELDEQPRATLYRRLGEILAEEQPYTMLYRRPALTLLSRRVRGARESVLGWQWADLWVATPGS